jgi:hypothetical protein
VTERSGDPSNGPEPRSSAEVPWPVLRQWSDALAAAGLFAEALRIYPAAERADVVRRAELAVLAGDHKLALKLLAELKAATSARTARTAKPVRRGGGRPGKPEPARPVSPWLELLNRTALLLAGDYKALPTVVEAARRVQHSAGAAWVVALAAAAAGDLKRAATAAEQARAGGCRDLRMLAVLAADRAAEGADRAAFALVAEAQLTALPDEDPIGYVVDLLDRAGFRHAAQRLAAVGAGDPSQSVQLRASWKASARKIGAGRKQVLRRSLTTAGSLGERHRERQERRLQGVGLRDLTCRCYGSAGWIGPDRTYYVDHHLSEVLPAPVAGLQARLLCCRATGLTFLDLSERELTLPVVSELARDQQQQPAAGEPQRPESDPEAQPTPSLGVSLGNVLNPLAPNP